MPEIPEHYKLAELEALPTIDQGHFDNLKIQTEDTRVWLSRMTTADGMPYDHQVTVEHLISGEWKAVDTYQAETEEDKKRYNVFHRTWWRRNPDRPDGREPGAGKRTYIARGVTYSEARRLCKEYNDTHKPGKLSRKAEFEGR